MGEFVQPTEPRSAQSKQLPSTAMNFGGEFLENIIPGYTTITVSGRETISNNIHTIGSGDVMNGAVVSHKTLPPREIHVQYLMRADNNEDLQEKFRVLMHTLNSNPGVYRGGDYGAIEYYEGHDHHYTIDELIAGSDPDDIIVYFNDDPDILYKGQVSDVSDIPPTSNTVMGEFTLYCQDPIKYSRALYRDSLQTDTIRDENTIDGSSQNVHISNPITPSRIDLTVYQGKYMMDVHQYRPYDYYDIAQYSQDMVDLQNLDVIIKNETTGAQIVLNIGAAPLSEAGHEYWLVGEQYERIGTLELSLDLKNGKIYRTYPNYRYLEYDIADHENMAKYVSYTDSEFYNFKISDGDVITTKLGKTSLDGTLGIAFTLRGEYL